MWTLTAITVGLFVGSALATTCHVPLDDETCLFVSLNVEDGVTYKAARRTCSGDGGKVAVIPDNKAYDLVMAYVRSILDKQDMDSIELWTGLKIDPLTGSVTKPRRSAFTKWNSYQGLATGLNFWEWTNVYLDVSANRNDEDQGMVNYKPTGSLDSVICQTVS